MIGKQVLHYRILEKLGEGGMGVVYKAEDTKLKRTVALKFLPLQAMAGDEEKARFEHEAQAAAALDHPNVCTIHEINEADGQTFIAMAYVEGKSLQDVVTQGPVPLPDLLNYAIQSAEGLQAAHEKEIVHRDIKPANILITEKAQVRIADFGLAKLAGRTQLTKESMSMGTVTYMSPEQTQGVEVDHRTDIWALGAVIYEMITGKQPFAGDYEQAVMYSILNEDPEPPTALRTGVAMELERIVLKALAKEPGERYQHIDEMLVDLKAVKHSSSTKQSRSGTIPPAETRERKTSKTLWFGVALLASGLAAGTLFFNTYFGVKPQPSAPPKLERLAVLPFLNIRQDPRTDFLGFALADQIIGSLSYIQGILVRPSSAIRQYQNQVVDPQSVGRNLKVDFVLTGNYLKEGEDLRLNVELVNTHSNEMIWRNPINVRYKSTFELQDLVAKNVIEGLEIQFSEGEHQLMMSETPGNALAYEYYLRAIAYPFTQDDNKLAIGMLEKSIALDSSYAPAYVELGDRLGQLAIYGFGGATANKKSQSAFLKALALNGRLLRALTQLANRYTETGRIDEASELLQRALQINPNNAYAHFALGYLYRYAGMLDASKKEYEKALSLDPKNPRFRSAGITYLYLKEYEQARQAFNLDPGSPFSLTYLGEIAVRTGNMRSGFLTGL